MYYVEIHLPVVNYRPSLSQQSKDMNESSMVPVA